MSFSNLLPTTYSTNIIIRKPFCIPYGRSGHENISREKLCGLWVTTLNSKRTGYLAPDNTEHTLTRISIYFNRNILFIYCKQCCLDLFLPQRKHCCIRPVFTHLKNMLCSFTQCSVWWWWKPRTICMRWKWNECANHFISALIKKI